MSELGLWVYDGCLNWWEWFESFFQVDFSLFFFVNVAVKRFKEASVNCTLRERDIREKIEKSIFNNESEKKKKNIEWEVFNYAAINYTLDINYHLV